MEITVNHKDGIVIIRIVGQLEKGNQLEEKINFLLEKNNFSLVIDFSELTYVSSSGLRVFLMTAKRVKKNSGHLVLFSMDDNIKEIFELTGFSSFIPIFPNEKQALEYFKQ